MSILKTIGIGLLVGCIGFVSGYFYTGDNTEEKLKIVYKTKIRYKVLKRDYSKMEHSECVKELSFYDTSKPYLDGEFINPFTFRVRASLHERTWGRDFKMEVSRDSNFKYYITAGAIGVLVGGYCVYRLTR